MLFLTIFQKRINLRCFSYDSCICENALPPLPYKNAYAMGVNYIIPREKNFCLHCGNPIDTGNGRQDRKFCSVACKNKYHNAGRQMLSRHYREKVIRILDNNNFILRRLLSMGVTSLDICILRQMQFNFDYSSSYHKIGRRQIYTCFDVQYELTPSRITKIRDLIDKNV